MHSLVLSCFFLYSFVYLIIYYSLNIFSLCIFVCICLFITTLISSYFSGWLSHSARLALAIFEWLCSPSFSQLFPFNVLCRVYTWNFYRGKRVHYLGKFLVNVNINLYLSKCGKRQRKFNHGKSDNDAVIWLGLAR